MQRLQALAAGTLRYRRRCRNQRPKSSSADEHGSRCSATVPRAVVTSAMRTRHVDSPSTGSKTDNIIVTNINDRINGHDKGRPGDTTVDANGHCNGTASSPCGSNGAMKRRSETDLCDAKQPKRKSGLSTNDIMSKDATTQEITAATMVASAYRGYVARWPSHDQHHRLSNEVIAKRAAEVLDAECKARLRSPSYMQIARCCPGVKVKDLAELDIRLEKTVGLQPLKTYYHAVRRDCLARVRARAFNACAALPPASLLHLALPPCFAGKSASSRTCRLGRRAGCAQCADLGRHGHGQEAGGGVRVQALPCAGSWQGLRRDRDDARPGAP
eukprot:5227677-Pleurochrysis_carterae.AAC.2